MMGRSPKLAATLRLPVGLLNNLSLALIAVKVAVSLQTVGVALMVAMLVTPAATAELLTRRLMEMLTLAAAFASLSGIIGLYLSYYLSIASGNCAHSDLFLFACLCLEANKSGIIR
jgi:manganese/iron transport system permease protein